ncbi:NRDE family protein [Flexistipes sp.]|uniref:NRDE family protein n=1 Tax=Flexistipes sp. TaxID=3088135 RepID=UPI002E21DFE5|nr:NRDE family protein [Flexistipes sp.]
MCFIVFSFKAHNKYKLIFCANRDEFYNRKTEKLHYWCSNSFKKHENNRILAGSDLQSGGTWLGVTKSGRFAALTNFREGTVKDPKKTSRGLIVKNFLQGNDDPVSYAKQLDLKKNRYEGFNLLFGSNNKLYYFSNRANGLLPISEGIYGLSNATLDTPWPKINRGKRLFKGIISREDVQVESLFEMLRDDKKPEKRELPFTGISEEFEKELSPIFVRINGYGTRSSSVILIDYNDNVEFYEKNYDSSGKEVNNSYYTFQII